MLPVKVIATVQPDGTLAVQGLPFPPGEQVEVTVAPVVVAVPSAAAPPDHTDDPTEGGKYPLRGKPGYYLDPFSPAWDPDEWEMEQ